MKRTITRILSAINIALLTAFTCSITAWAGNPDTGDSRGQMIGWVMIALGAAVVVLIVIGISSGKKKKK